MEAKQWTLRRKEGSRAIYSGSEQVFVWEYSLATAQERDEVQRAKAGLVGLRHPNICEFIEEQSYEVGQRHCFSLTSAAVDSNLAGETQQRLRSDQRWNVDEVAVITQSLLSAADYAAREVRSTQGFHCTDWSPGEVAWHQGKALVSAWDRGDYVDFSGLKVGLVSPELRELYGQWSLGAAPAASGVDFGKTEVYSIAVLALFLLSPKHFDFPPSNISKLIEELQLPDYLAAAFSLMLQPAPKDRLTISESLLAMNTSPEGDVFRLNRLQGKPRLARTYMERLIAHELRADVAIACSGCKRVTRVEETSSNCGTHVHCADCASPHCNECERRQKCSRCGVSFSANSVEVWRLQYLGSTLYTEALSVCAPKCMPVDSSPDHVEEVKQDDKSGKLLPLLMEFRTGLKEKLELLNLSVRATEITKELEDPHDFIQLRRSSCSEKADSLLSRIIENVHRVNGNSVCHLCNAELVEITRGRFLQCGLKLHFACSEDCVRSVFSGDGDALCPRCNETVPQESIHSALGIGQQKCINCVKKDATPRSCGHLLCSACGGTDSCRYCSLVLVKEKCRRFLQH